MIPIPLENLTLYNVTSIKIKGFFLQHVGNKGGKSDLCSWNAMFCFEFFLLHENSFICVGGVTVPPAILTVLFYGLLKYLLVIQYLFVKSCWFWKSFHVFLISYLIIKGVFISKEVSSLNLFSSSKNYIKTAYNVSRERRIDKKLCLFW